LFGTEHADAFPIPFVGFLFFQQILQSRVHVVGQAWSSYCEVLDVFLASFNRARPKRQMDREIEEREVVACSTSTTSRRYNDDRDYCYDCYVLRLPSSVSVINYFIDLIPNT
jgi:hypothetical protein